MLANAISAYIPEFELMLPFIGTFDARPYVVALVVFVVLSFVFWLVRRVLLVRLEALSKKTSNDYDDLIIGIVRGVKAWVYVLVAFFVAVQILTLPGWLDTAFRAVFLVAVVWQAVDAAVVLVDFITRRFIEKDEDGDGVTDPNSATASNMIGLFTRIILISLGFLFILSNLGIEVTALLAGLGVGGIAIAFALQGVLGDLFSSLSIYLDKPFRIGDFIMVGADSGVVEKIGIKTTRIRTLQGEELVISNTELTSARVQNFKKMDERRIAATFGILYETPHEKVKEVPQMIERIFESIEGARLDRAHMSEFGDSALIFEYVYYVTTPDYNEYMDIKQRVNFQMMDKFAEVGIEFAYPTRTLRFDSSNVLSIRTEK